MEYIEITDLSDLGFFVYDFILSHVYFTSRKIPKYYIESRLSMTSHKSSSHPQLRSLTQLIRFQLRSLLDIGRIEK